MLPGACRLQIHTVRCENIRKDLRIYFTSFHFNKIFIQFRLRGVSTANKIFPRQAILTYRTSQIRTPHSRVIPTPTWELTMANMPCIRIRTASMKKIRWYREIILTCFCNHVFPSDGRSLCQHIRGVPTKSRFGRICWHEDQKSDKQ